MKQLLTLLVVAVFVTGCSSTKNPEQDVQAGPAAMDYGDFSSQTLTTKAWEALGEGDYMTAVKYTEKCVELYEEEAKKMQASLSEKAPKDKVHDYWALNDVGTSYFIRGEALMTLGKKTEAHSAFRTVMDELSFAQTWDPKGWFWSPADAARQRVILLSNDF